MADVANLASQGSLTATLDALAAEVLRTGALAAVQIVTLDAAGSQLRIMGSAGFGHWPDFFDRLMECRRRGGALRMLDAFRLGEPVLVANRWSIIKDDPAWAPLRDYLGEQDWDSFASIPLIARGKTLGVLNAFFAPTQTMTPHRVEFLVTMANQAAIDVDYATLLRDVRDVTRREERQRLARDLHDSIVQQVFSIGLQAKTLEVLAQRDAAVPAEAVARIAGEVGEVSRAVLADLRAMVHELQPSSAAVLGGLEGAVRSLAESTANRTGLRVRVEASAGLGRIGEGLAEDAYRIIAEALNNVVRHADAAQVIIRLELISQHLYATVTDDGQGMPAGAARGGPGGAAGGYGLTTMRERAERWGGTVQLGRGNYGGGTRVRVTVPLSGPSLLGPESTR